MKFAMCNEFCEGWTIDEVFRLAAEAGYEGVEIAPFTMAESVTQISLAERRRIRESAKDHGVAIAGLHWLLASPKGLSTNGRDAALCKRTADYFKELIRFCADLGGTAMTIGSPKARDIVPGQTREETWKRTVEFYREVSPAAWECGVMLGMEPLGRQDTNFLNTKDEVVRLIEEVNLPNYQLTLDCKAMADEGKPLPQIIEEAAEYLVHFHANDDNRSYPGTGSLDFASILRFHAGGGENCEGGIGAFEGVHGDGLSGGCPRADCR
jgi:sugar phosphate isomerase/epimerase